MNEKAIHLPGLNGLRSIAALSVIACHILYANIGERFLVHWGIAYYAVTMFYVISGFLITFLLLKEREKNQTISIKKFYFRRILRIWPIYYLYIFIAAIVVFLYGDSDKFWITSLVCFVFMAGNLNYLFSEGDIHLLSHFWSIGVEEQFYLFWPWLVRLFKSFKILLIVSIIFIIGFMTLKLLVYNYLGVDTNIYMVVKQTRFHCMMIGVVGAILYNQKNKSFMSFFSNKFLQSIAWLFYFALGFNLIHIPVFFSHELIAIATLVMIIGQIVNPILNLETRYFDFLGRISYGLYIIHPLVLYLLASVFIKIQMYDLLKWAIFFVLSSTISIGLAWLSYKYFEMPFLRLKSKFAVVKSANVSK